MRSLALGETFHMGHNCVTSQTNVLRPDVPTLQINNRKSSSQSDKHISPLSTESSLTMRTQRIYCRILPGHWREPGSCGYSFQGLNLASICPSICEVGFHLEPHCTLTQQSFKQHPTSRVIAALQAKRTSREVTTLMKMPAKSCAQLE